MKKLFASTFVFAASTMGALANPDPACGVTIDPADPRCATAVPEISALEGMAALALLAAVVAIVWERRRRAV